MKVAVATLKSMSVLSWSKFVDIEKLHKESNEDYENRNWKEKFHYNKDGNCIIPQMAIKNCLDNAAGYLGMQIKGKGKSTYKKLFLSGIIVLDPVVLPHTRDDIAKESFMVPSDGRKGGGKRVLKHFPTIQEWEGEAKIHIIDESISEEVLRAHLDCAGLYIGLGFFRPQVGGYRGRFTLSDLTIEK
jgi:hypothetical protein